jgi:hypothetical protein
MVYSISCKVRKIRHVTMDTTIETALIVLKYDGGTIRFKEHIDVLYYFYTHDVSTTGSVLAHTFFHTVQTNKQRFVTREINLADKARELHQKLAKT